MRERFLSFLKDKNVLVQNFSSTNLRSLSEDRITFNLFRYYYLQVGADCIGYLPCGAIPKKRWSMIHRVIVNLSYSSDRLIKRRCRRKGEAHAGVATNIDDQSVLFEPGFFSRLNKKGGRQWVLEDAIDNDVGLCEEIDQRYPLSC